MHIPNLSRIVVLIGLICAAAIVRAGDGGGIVARAILDGSKNQVHQDSAATVEDSAFFNASGFGVDTGYSVQNVITLKINEASTVYMRTAFTATVRLLISYSNGNDTASIQKDFTINYDTGHNYNARNSFVFYGGRKVTVKILSVNTNGATWDVASVLMVENQLTARPKYNFVCTNTVTNITVSPSGDAKADELPVSWTAIRGADQYDLEWTYIDSSALDRYKNGGGSLDPGLIFFHNATRISTTGNTYNIPLIYDNSGTLFIRVRPVQISATRSVVAATWSSDASPSVMGQYQFTGHERLLNWQSNISFSEDGMRKVVVQYFDGSLRSRQTVTKDNSINKTIVAETYYDYQGRPAIQVMPAPSFKNVIQYTAGFNVNSNHAEYSQSDFDTLSSLDAYCDSHADEMSSDSGASRYYSPNNPEKTIGLNQFIPDAHNYPFTEVEYTQDNTNRVSRQGGVGRDHRLGSGHETKYYYGTPDQSELDALFGTDVGDHSHYYKNMVRDANGQYSVSYLDMHNRTIATALTGIAPASMTTLPSSVERSITENLVDSGTRYLQNWSLVNQKSLVVPQIDNYTFHYRLDPSLVTESNCSQQNICYTCLYDLEINITDNCNNQLLPGKKAFDTVVHNFSFDQISNSCTPTPLAVNFNLVLQEGSYLVTKQLTINRDAYLYYRDSIYLPNNTCKSMQDFIDEQRTIIAQTVSACVPDCKTCRDSVGTWEHYRDNFIAKAGIVPADTAAFTAQIATAYKNALQACDALCGDSATDDNDIRNAMLQDMTPPYGQYADTSANGKKDKFNIFYLDPKDTLSYIPVYRLEDVNYLDDNGQPDKVYNMQSDLMVDPGSLSVGDFTQNFRSSWAEALLPYHPEYCKLKALEALKASNAWDRKMEATDNFRDALNAGYLNPTGNGSYWYPINNTDPLINVSGQKSKLDAKLGSYLTFKNGTTVSMWGMSNVMAKCDSGNAACVEYYSNKNATTKSHVFDTLAICEGDLDMAWRSFRQLYLNYKKDLVNALVNNPTGCTPLNQAYSSIPKYEDLLNVGHKPEFSEDTKTTADKNDLSYVMQGATDAGAAANAASQAKSQLNDYFDQNSEAFVTQWTTQLSPCAYSDAALKDTILPLLKGLCRMACDVDHPFGASTLPAGKDYQGYHSFEEIINQYNSSHGITTGVTCNVDLITAPAPYDKQPVYSNKPVFTKPSDCECKLINDLFTVYLITRQDASFAAFLKRTQGVTMSDADLNMLRQLCNRGKVTTEAGVSCQYLSQPIYLPPAMQCNSGESCTSCTVVNNLYQSYKEQYPNDTPRISDADDTVQIKRNNFFKNYMNNRLGYGLETWQYLQFLQQCADSAAHISNVTKCEDQRIGNLYLTLSNEPGKLHDIQPTPDGGYIMAGSIGLTAKEGTLVKTDSSGVVQWAKKYGGLGSDSLLRVRRTSDNGYIAIGTTHSGHYATGAVWVIKTNNAGDVSWTKTIGFNTPFGEHGYDILETSDGGFAALGIYNQHSGHGEFLLSRLQSNGTINWVRRFGTSRLQNNSTECIPNETDSLSYDGIPSYGLLQQEDTLLISGAAYDHNLGERYYGVVYRVNKTDGTTLSTWHYADAGDSTRSCWFRDIYATENGFMIMVNSAQKLSTTNAQVGVLNISKTGGVISYQRSNIPSGSNKMVSSSLFPVAGGGYMVAQTGNNSAHIIWQRVDASGNLLWATETSLTGNQTVGRIAQKADSSFTLAGENNQQLLMLALHPNYGCYDNTVELGITNQTITRTPWAIDVDEFVSPMYTDTTLATYAYTLTDSMLTCPGSGSCHNIYSGPLLCGKSQPLLPPVDIDYTGTCSDSTFFSVSKGTELYKVYSDSLTGAFEQNYINKCLQAYQYESFTVTHPKREYHYTLFYYDQAGNLVRTVPPAGVHEITDTTVLKQVVAARAAGTELVPAHTMATDYRYNSLNQIIAQHTPDAGISYFWFDRLGRLSVSQNAKQKDSAQYSYTKYDVIGRTTEIGQLKSSTAMADAISRDPVSLNQWLNNAANTADQITKTTYDLEYIPLQPVLKARNLRNRVAWSALYNTASDLANNEATTATYYSYDILGNVDTLVQDYRAGAMGNNANRFKKIAYDFDLVSGKVNQVSYQPGQPDAFYHRYVHDAENRITNVLTSVDSINWDNDVFYQYYDHGVLARTVLGEQQVQGINYTYNLQGWMKSINPDVYTGAGYTLKADGSLGSVVGKTAFNVILNYFNGDYDAVSGATPQDASLNTTLGSEYRPLFNGNLSSMGVNIGPLNNPLLYNYQYDQLNRLVAIDAWQKTGNAWNNLTPRNDFQERASYDANGNILSYKRNGNNFFAGKPLEMDSLSYSYIAGTNKLDHINDNVPASNYTSDIDNQPDGNYKYDAIGNLIKDSSEKLTGISWTVYGKISRIIKDDGTTIAYTYDANGNRISKVVTKTSPVTSDTTWYVRDAQGNVLSVYIAGKDSINNGHLSQTELNVYGSSRVGLLRRSFDVAKQFERADTAMLLLGTGYSVTFARGDKFFELSNHLGNVLVTVNDKKIGVSSDNSTIDYFKPQIVSAQDYYPFGMLEPEREFNVGSYRYGFNGKEMDNEVKGEGAQYDYGFRIYDPRVGRFLSVDPLTKEYPWFTPYQFSGNMPTIAIDLDGMEAKIVTIIHGTQNREILRTDFFNEKAEKVENGHWEIHKYYSFAGGKATLLREEKTKVVTEVKSPVGTVNLSTSSLGKLSEQYESGGKGPGVISSGNGDPGGASYGVYQLSSNMGTLQDFLNNEGATWAPGFEGLSPGSDKFNAKWKEIAKTQTDDFRSAQHNFIYRTHYQIQKQKVLKSTGLNVDNYSGVLKDVVWSVAVQHGAYGKVIINALKDKDLSKMSEKDIINAIYDERESIDTKTNKLKYFKKVGPGWKTTLQERFVDERKDALDRLDKEKDKK